MKGNLEKLKKNIILKKKVILLCIHMKVRKFMNQYKFNIIFNFFNNESLRCGKVIK